MIKERLLEMLSSPRAQWQRISPARKEEEHPVLKPCLLIDEPDHDSTCKRCLGTGYMHCLKVNIVPHPTDEGRWSVQVWAGAPMTQQLALIERVSLSRPTAELIAACLDGARGISLNSRLPTEE